ncbi:WecB/TagA/CpsF family glycosyltransferase [Phenylobacterium sp.]|jgi:N-acetylglucosaminyldiphosphoundecaprenol N-acetyl-beta-D-mannosaminyltransferase|uniref:WecB/TagA/CpsF family glycosyltransferase n=1 Tax=Phenylobacterium sp. TaxID=1871053 RepID=UPI002E3649EC|nr:WecB/TagA/CpsF family glycosyltransferase [Phenylobacterium sp.]HEX2561724.1 WecB/TagA/CpsF family glycosyltransferase [Phenylobacterium sp.]
METRRPERIALLGAEVDLITPQEVMEALAGFVASGQPAVIANHNAHSLYLLRREPHLPAFFRTADLIEIDSRPMILWGRLLGLPVHGRHRCTYLDWREDFWSLAERKGWRVFYLGGAPGVAESGAERLRLRWPGLELAVRHGYFDARAESEENLDVVAQIRAYDPHVVLVGMGMPRQEAWIHQNRTAFRRGVFMPVGAALDYEAGVQSMAPRWLGPVGLEWLYRLATQPRRLAFRYLVEPWFLLPAMARDVAARLKGRRGPASARAVGAANGRR